MLWGLSSRAGARRVCTQITLENTWTTTHFPIMLRAIKATQSMHDLDRPSRAILNICYKTNVNSAFLQTPTPRTHRIWTSVSQTCPDVPTSPPLRHNKCLKLTLKRNTKTYAKPSSYNRRDVKATAGKKFIRISHYDSSNFSQSLSAFSLARRNARSRLNKPIRRVLACLNALNGPVIESGKSR